MLAWYGIIIGHEWNRWNIPYFPPYGSIKTGTDTDGDTIYVGRAYHNGQWLPAKIIYRRYVAYVPYEGKEYALGNFQVKHICIVSNWMHN